MLQMLAGKGRYNLNEYFYFEIVKKFYRKKFKDVRTRTIL